MKKKIKKTKTKKKQERIQNCLKCSQNFLFLILRLAGKFTTQASMNSSSLTTPPLFAALYSGLVI